MRYLIVLLLGLLLGGGTAVFFLGYRGTRSAPGAPIKSPDAGGEAATTAVIELPDRFLNELLATMFRDLGPPSFRLAQGPGTDSTPTIQQIAFQEGCTNAITLMPQGSNVQTQVQFAGGKISAPLAFNGNYNLMGNCMQFKGWAQTSIQLRFDQSSQAVYGQVNVEGVNLEGVNPLANSLITVFVRSAIDERINPLLLIRNSQLQLLVPVKASNGSVGAQVKDVRSEVLDGSLRLHVSYAFAGTRQESKQ